jgi:uracil-DNA glycosylase
VDFLACEERDPFDLDPPCERAVPSFGPTDADFHVVGDHPGVHGGTETGIPFTDQPWSERFFDVLVGSGLVDAADAGIGDIESSRTFFSYLHSCVPVDGTPTAQSYDDLEPYFDSELRAITAHVLLPVGRQATAHVFESYTPIDAERAADMPAIHGEHLHGSGWLVVPVVDPAEWTDGLAETLVDSLRELVDSDYRQISDLGRFLPGKEPYYVR